MKLTFKFDELKKISRVRVALVVTVVAGSIIKGVQEGIKNFISSNSEELLRDLPNPLTILSSIYPNKDIKDEQLKKFLEHVCLSEKNEVREMLEEKPTLALAQDNFCDYGKRYFKHVSGLQYAVWALDYNMFEMIIKTIQNKVDKNKISRQLKDLSKDGDGIKIGQPLLSEWRKCDWSELNLQENENKLKKSKTDTSVDSLIEAIQNFEKSYSNMKYEELCELWCNQIGRTQLLLPAHIIRRYLSHKESFLSTDIRKDFEGSEITREKFNSWYEENSKKLGENYAHVRGAGPRCRSWDPSLSYIRVFNALANTHVLNVLKITDDLITILDRDKNALNTVLNWGKDDRHRLFDDYKLLPPRPKMVNS